MVARLQMSDLHLGDPRSSLSNPEVAAEVVAQLAKLTDKKIGKLILAGDAWEECVPGNVGSLSDGVACSVRLAADNFFGLLFRTISVAEVVWVPGNHDLSTWVWYCQTSLGQSVVTDYAGRRVDAGSWPFRLLLPGHAGKLTVSYPIYWDMGAGDNSLDAKTGVSGDYPLLAVTHGHLLDSLVLGWDSLQKYEFLKSIGCRRSVVPMESEKVGSLKKLAEQTLEFCLALWKRYSPRDYTYSNHIMRRLDHPQSCTWQSLSPRQGCFYLEECDLKADVESSALGHTRQLSWFLETMIMDPYLPTPVGSLRQGEVSRAFTSPSCLTFGHDHLGIHQHVVSCGVPFVCVDSGGWTSEYEGHLPHTHVLKWEAEADVVPSVHLILARTSSGKIL